MKMTKLKERGRQILLGLLVGLILVPTQPVNAQWAVYDGVNHATQIERMVQDAARWIETVNHYVEEINYATMINNQVEQITRLGNIMRTVDEQLSRNRNLINTVANFGQTVRQIFQLQQDIRTMVNVRILAVQRVWDRMRNGIFDPAQNMRDLEEYMRHSIGKPSQQRIQYHELLLEQDAEFGEAVYQREVAMGRLARADYNATTQSNAAGLHNQFGQINAARTGTLMTNNAAAAREQANLISVYRNSMTNVAISRDAQIGLVDADRSFSTQGASNQTAREQGQVLLNQQTQSNTNEQGWWTLGTEAVGGVLGAAGGGARGSHVGTSAGSIASRPGQIVTEGVNIEMQARGGLGLSSD